MLRLSSTIDPNCTLGVCEISKSWGETSEIVNNLSGDFWNYPIILQATCSRNKTQIIHYHYIKFRWYSFIVVSICTIIIYTINLWNYPNSMHVAIALCGTFIIAKINETHARFDTRRICLFIGIIKPNFLILIVDVSYF